MYIFPTSMSTGWIFLDFVTASCERSEYLNSFAESPMPTVNSEAPPNILITIRLDSNPVILILASFSLSPPMWITVVLPSVNVDVWDPFFTLSVSAFASNAFPEASTIVSHAAGPSTTAVPVGTSYGSGSSSILLYTSVLWTSSLDSLQRPAQSYNRRRSRSFALADSSFAGSVEPSVPYVVRFCCP